MVYIQLSTTSTTGFLKSDKASITPNSIIQTSEDKPFQTGLEP